MKYFSHKATLGKYYAPGRTDELLAAYASPFLDFYGMKRTHLEKAIFEWLGWFKRKHGMAVTLERISGATGATQGSIIRAMDNILYGIISWEKIHIPPPMAYPPGSSEQADFEKEWYGQIKEKKIWAEEPTTASALRYMIKLEVRPWDLILIRDAFRAVNHAERVCQFKQKRQRGEVVYVDEELCFPKVMVESLEERKR